jgi:hypothetical protein
VTQHGTDQIGAAKQISIDRLIFEKKRVQQAGMQA